MPEVRAATAECRIREPLIDGFRGPFSADAQRDAHVRVAIGVRYLTMLAYSCRPRLAVLAAICPPAENRHSRRRASKLFPYRFAMTMFVPRSSCPAPGLHRLGVSPSVIRSSGLRFALRDMVKLLRLTARMHFYVLTMSVGPIRGSYCVDVLCYTKDVERPSNLPLSMQNVAP